MIFNRTVAHKCWVIGILKPFPEMNNNMNNFEFTPYSFKEEDLRMLSKEDLITNILGFTYQVNNQFESLIALAKSPDAFSDSAAVVDTKSNEYLKLLHQEKTQFEKMGVCASTLRLLQKKVTCSKSDLLVKKTHFESSKDQYIKKNIHVHALH